MKARSSPFTVSNALLNVENTTSKMAATRSLREVTSDDIFVRGPAVVYIYTGTGRCEETSRGIKKARYWTR